MLSEECRVTEFEVGLVTLGGKGHADTGQHLPTALANDPSSKTIKKEPDKGWNLNFQRVFWVWGVSHLRAWDILLLMIPARHTWPCSSVEVWGLADKESGVTSRVGPTPEELSSWRLDQLPLDKAGLLLGALMICHPEHWDPDFFHLFCSLETTADKEQTQPSPLVWV